MDHDAFIEQAWRDHADDAAGVADRIERAIAGVEAPAHVAPFARLATHVFGEHLGEWQRGREVLARLRDAARGDDDARRAIERGAAALACAGGAADPCRGLGDDDRIAALATAASALAARDDHGRALVAYDEALRVAAGGLREGSPALRALAVGGNNLAASLEAKSTRSERETRGMVDAASAALVYWKRAGGWLEEERAEYRLAMSQLAAGDAFEAAEHARRCLDVCARHGAPPLERFFGTVALARAERALGDDASYRRLNDDARAIHASLAGEERAMAEADLASLDAR